METREVPDAIPFARRAEQVQSPTLPLPPPKDAITTEAFLTWVANMPRDQVKEVRETIGSFENKPAVAAILNEQLLCLPCSDTSRHLILLSTIGELCETSSINALERFTWLSDEQIFEGIPIMRERCSFSSIGMLQARAAEMMVWVLRGTKDDLVLRVIQDHPLRAVRIAAIDAYLFQRNDAPEAVEFLRSQVSLEDQSMIGLPRFGADIDPKTFERLITEYEAAHPSVTLPPKKKRVSIWLGLYVAIIALGLLLALMSMQQASIWLGICATIVFTLGLLLVFKINLITIIKRSTQHVH